MRKFKHPTARLRNKIILEGHGIEVPEYLCDTAAGYAAKAADEITEINEGPLSARIQDSIQDHLDEESRIHRSLGNLIPRKKRVEG